MKRRVVGFVALGLALAAPAAAAADGLPVPVEDTGGEGITGAEGSPSGDVRYVTMESGRDTVVALVDRADGRLIRSRALPGRFGVPAVATDGTASGLSFDGRTLVLIRPRTGFPRERTTFAVLDGWRLRVRDVVTLRGDFSFDAISPDGSLMYLIEYVSPRDPTRYLVRAYDLRRGRLLPEPVVDPRADAESMRGFPMTRVTSPGGRWEYTLYDGGGHPFVHALDTARGKAVCIDIHALEGRNPYNASLILSPGGRTLTVQGRKGPLALVDTTTFEVSDPPEPEADEQGSGPPWFLLLPLGLLGLVVLTVTARLIRRRRSVVTVPAVPRNAPPP